VLKNRLDPATTNAILTMNRSDSIFLGGSFPRQECIVVPVQAVKRYVASELTHSSMPHMSSIAAARSSR
jgi:hypothetical protein